MAIEFKNPADAVLNQGIKLLIFGAAGSGKTVTCATSKEPTLIISTEGGLLSIKDAPKTIQIVECATRDDVEEVLAYLQQKKPPAWVCIDSISEIAEVVLAEELAKTKDPRKAYGELAVTMTSIIKAFRNLNTNVVMTAKLDRVKDDMTRVDKDNEGRLVRSLQTNRDGQWDAKDRSGKLDIFEKPNLAEIRNKILGIQPKSKAA